MSNTLKHEISSNNFKKVARLEMLKVKAEAMLRLERQMRKFHEPPDEYREKLVFPVLDR